MDEDRISKVALELRQSAKAGLSDDSSQHRRRLLERCPILRSLAPIQIAGASSRAQYEYLIQAIIDAIDVIGKPALGQSPAPPTPPRSESARESEALRTLFGLTGQSRGKKWQFRQEQAAASFSVSWDYFRHAPQLELLRSLAEQMLNAAQRNHPPTVFDRRPGLWAFATQNDVESETIEYIQSDVPHTAKMLEFSTATTGAILRALREADSTIYLLAANPEKVSGWHKDRMRQALSDLLQIHMRDYTKLRFRLYNVPPSLRGRHIGELITIGWYTYRDNMLIDGSDPASTEVWGHDNAVVTGRNTEVDGTALAVWFSREFDRLWGHRSTLDEAASAEILDNF
jgi:hypothetical protein